MSIRTAPSAAPLRESTRVGAERAFRPDVEGLRAVAVGLVVLFHAGVTWLPGGYVGVDVFFVLSGFLITGLLLREAASTGTVSIGGFYARRARRILPASMLVIVVTVLASHWLLNFVRAQQVYADARWAAGFLANVRFSAVGTDYLQASAPPSALQHYWSLAVEEQFYLVWPLLILLVVKLMPRDRMRFGVGAVLVVLSSGSFAWCLVQTAQAATEAYFSAVTRAWELGVGALLAVGAGLLRRLPRILGRWLSWLGVAGVVASAAVFTERTAFPGSAALLPVLGTALVVAGGTVDPGGGAEVLLRRRPLQWLGAMSFSLYLWHWPVLVVGTALHGGRLSTSSGLALVAVSLVVAVLTFHLLENPVRRSPRLVARSSNSLGFGALALVAVLFACNVLISDAATARAVAVAAARDRLSGATLEAGGSGVGPHLRGVAASVATSARVQRLPPDVTPALGELTAHASPANFDGCLVYARKTSSPPCRYGDVRSKRTVVLFGDSHAAQWLPALDVTGTRQGFALVLLTKSLCPFPSVTVYNKVDKRPFRECDDWRSWALRRIRTLHPALVVVSSTAYGVSLPSAPHSQDGLASAWTAGARTTLRRIKAAAGRVVLLGDAPVMSAEPAQCLADHPGRIDTCAQPTTRAVREVHDGLQRRVAKNTGTPYVDVFDWFCTRTVCPMVVNGVVTHVDRWHLTADYATLLAKPLGRALRLPAR